MPRKNYGIMSVSDRAKALSMGSKRGSARLKKKAGSRKAPRAVPGAYAGPTRRKTKKKGSVMSMRPKRGN